MKVQLENLVLSSFYLWLNNFLSTKGEAFVNHGSQFYKINENINGLFAYAIPYGQMVSDTSVTGANVPTGLYINNVYTPIGSGGLIDINYDRGVALFSSEISGQISGNYGIKDFNIYTSEVSEQELLFEQSFNLRPKTNQTIRGIELNENSFPCIYIVNKTVGNEPFAMGGVVMKVFNFSLFVFSDSKFQADAVASLLTDTYHKYLPIFYENEMPYNVYGGFSNGVPFNFKTEKSKKVMGSIDSLFIDSVNKVNLSQKINSEIRKMNPKVYFSILDFVLKTSRVLGNNM